MVGGTSTSLPLVLAGAGGRCTHHPIQEGGAACQLRPRGTELPEQQAPDGLPLTQTVVVTLCRPRWELLGSQSWSPLAGYFCLHHQALGPSGFQLCSVVAIMSFRALTTTLR